jgi:hypothetical protein
LFVMVTWAPKPEPQSLPTEYTAVQPGVVAAWEVPAVKAAKPPATPIVRPAATKALVNRRAGRSRLRSSSSLFMFMC